MPLPSSGTPSRRCTVPNAIDPTQCLTSVYCTDNKSPKKLNKIKKGRSPTLAPILDCYSALPDVSFNISLIRRMNLKQRTLVIKLCQAQTLPYTRHTTLWNMMNNAPPLDMTLGDEEEYVQSQLTFLNFIMRLKGIGSPVMSAFTLDMARGLPLPYSEVSSAKKDGWNKEFSVMEENQPPFRLNFRCLFDPLYADEPILPELPPNRLASQTSYLCFWRWRKKVSNRLFYPRMTFKNMSRDTIRDYENHTGLEWDRSTMPIFGQTNYERFYMKTGVSLVGACETRQRWYPAQAKPRTYNAQGGDTYAPSKYLQDPILMLLEETPMTDHKTKLHPARLRLKLGQHARVYDLETFTSRMFEERNFGNHLAGFCNGYSFSYMDSREGLVTRDLGEVLWEYNQLCNMYPRVSYERYIREAGAPHISVHNMASMLGVFGNLAMCNAGHGHTILQIVEDDSQVNVAGDDAVVAEDEHNEVLLDMCIDALGRDQKEKRFRSDEEGCICLKRPLYQIGNTLEARISIVPPSIINLARNLNDYADPRYPTQYDQFKTQRQRLSTAGRELMRFLRSLWRVCESIPDQHLEEAVEYCRLVTRAFGVPDNQGRLPQCGDEFLWPIIESSIEDVFALDPMISLVQSRYTGRAQIPRRADISVELSEVCCAGNEFSANSTEHLSYLTKLGFFEKDMLFDQVEGYEGYLWLIKSLYSHDSYVYHFVCQEDVPFHLII